MFKTGRECTKTRQVPLQHKTLTIALVKQRFVTLNSCWERLVCFCGYSRYVDFTKIVSSVKGFLINIFLYKVVTSLRYVPK